MTGKNEIHINEATMLEALNLYLQSKFREGHAPKATSVKESSKNSGAYGREFVVVVNEPEGTDGT